MNIPLLIPNHNQFTYLKNLINWFKWYYPNNAIFIIDNASDYPPLLKFYEEGNKKDFYIFRYEQNDCATNLRKTIDFLTTNHKEIEYYIISDPDIMPHPNTPPNFLEVFKYAIDNYGFHRAGFGLITDELPDYLHQKSSIVENEKGLLSVPNHIDMGGMIYKGFKAPIDTTFCLYKVSNGGWTAPMNGKDWSNCLRLFNAFHFGWYIHPDYVNAEMDNYFRTSNYRDGSPISAGKNNCRPAKYVK